MNKVDIEVLKAAKKIARMDPKYMDVDKQFKCFFCDNTASTVFNDIEHHHNCPWKKLKNKLY